MIKISKKKGLTAKTTEVSEEWILGRNKQSETPRAEVTM